MTPSKIGGGGGGGGISFWCMLLAGDIGFGDICNDLGIIIRKRSRLCVSKAYLIRNGRWRRQIIIVHVHLVHVHADIVNIVNLIVELLHDHGIHVHLR